MITKPTAVFCLILFACYAASIFAHLSPRPDYPFTAVWTFT